MIIPLQRFPVHSSAEDAEKYDSISDFQISLIRTGLRRARHLIKPARARARTACWLSDTCTCRERSPLLAYKHIDEHLHPICCSIDSSLLQSPGLLHWWRDIKMYALNLCFLLKQSLKACCTLIYN